MMHFSFLVRAIRAFDGGFRRRAWRAWLLYPAVVSLAIAAAPSPDQVAATRPFVSPIFGDNMVLQRGKPNTLWGWTHAGDAVRVRIGSREANGVAGLDGRWQVQIEPPATKEEVAVEIDGPQQVELRHVLVGDVWLCGGQSNMQFGLPGVRDGATEVASADRPRIRFFIVKSHSAYAPASVPSGAWRVCSPQTVGEDGGLSAVAYFFARRVQAETGVAIGLVQDCLGGTPAETWMSSEALARFPEFKFPLDEVDRLRGLSGPQYGNYIMHWYDEYDAGVRGSGWWDPVLDEHGWKPVHVPGAFGDLGLAEVPAVVWLRREIMLPDPLPAGAATLNLGIVEKMDTAYLNGSFVGASSWVENPRVYRVPAGVLHAGRNQIALRVFKLKSKESFLSPPETLQLRFTGGPDFALAGEWKAAVSVDARPPHPLPLAYENYPVMPTVLYAGMLQPIAPLALTGVLWYQGEANTPHAAQYRALLPELIGDWRRLFGQGDLPFYIVSLPAFQARQDQPTTDGWAELREAQAMAARTVPNCGLAVTIDTGEADNIHPKDKVPVGERLARLALAGHYGKEVVTSGPTFRSAERVGAALRVRFDHCDSGLVVHGDKPGEFAVAGADQKWHWAEARLDSDDAVVVSSNEVPEPVAVRYAWQSNPKATLFNGAGLPATPFRSDDWPVSTTGKTAW